jgi:hypothetical protein
MARQKFKSPIPANKQDFLAQLAMTRHHKYYEAGKVQQALDQALVGCRLMPSSADNWTSAGICCLHLQQWEKAVEVGLKCEALQPEHLPAYDILADAYGGLRNWEKSRVYGLKALSLRDGRIPPLPSSVSSDITVRPPPSPETANLNIISFSLFGANPKYCEGAVFNAQDSQVFYPNWTCRFYVDQTVPAKVVRRLLEEGAQVHRIEEHYRKWPGTMWRFIPLEDRSLHRVLFRDADSILSDREAGAVAEWVESGKPFHVMRDFGSHTDLILAGMWGAVVGVLPSLGPLIDHFLANVDRRRTTDQEFLGKDVWPHLRDNSVKHDSLFGHLDAQAFPDGPIRNDFQVGIALTMGSITLTPPTGFEVRAGTQMIWTIYSVENANGQQHWHELCSYPGIVNEGKIIATIPERYVKGLMDKTMVVQVREG